MAARRTTTKADEPELVPEDPAKDQTPEEAELAAKEADEGSWDQTEEEALEAAELAAKDDSFKPVGDQEDSTDEEIELSSSLCKMVRSGFFVEGRILNKGNVVKLPDEIASQSPKEQRDLYGNIYFEKA